MVAEARRRFGPGGFPVPVLLGLLPLQSARHAEFLHNEVPGITIPDEAAGRDARRRRPRRGGRAGADAWRSSSRSRAASPGTYVMPSFGRYEQAAELVRRIRRERAGHG